MSWCRSLGLLVAIAAAAACELGPKKVTPISDPIHDAIEETPANSVGLFVFRDRVVIRNRAVPLTECQVILDETMAARAGAVPTDSTITMMASRFSSLHGAGRVLSAGQAAAAHDVRLGDGTGGGHVQ